MILDVLKFISLFSGKFKTDNDDGLMLDNLIKFVETKPANFPGLIYPSEE